MEWTWTSLAAAAILLLGCGLVIRIRWRECLPSREITRAVGDFRLQREQLEAKFFDLASNKKKPRGLRWLDCDWQDHVTFARDVRSGLLTAFVGVNIRFEAIEDEDMVDVEAVGTVRDAAAVFHYQRGRWGTGGRALFNMDPQDALARLEGQFEPVTVETSAV